MAEKVELIIEAQNNEAIRNIKETQKAFQDLHKTSVAEGKKHQDSIAGLEAQMKKLFQENKKGFSDINKLNAYTKKMDELKKKYEELTKAEKDKSAADQQLKKTENETSESLGTLAKKAGLMAAAFGLVSKVIDGVITAFKDTVIGMNAVTYAGELWTQMTYNIATGNFNMAQSFVVAMAAAKQKNELRKEERKDLIEAARLQTEYNQLYFESADRTKDDNVRLEKMNQAMDAHNKMIDIELKNTKEQLSIITQQLIIRPKSNKLLDEEAKLKAKLIEIEGRRYSETKRLEGQRTALEEQIWEKKKKAYLDEIDEANKVYDKRLKDFEDFWDEWNKIEEEALKEAIKINDQLRDEYNRTVVDTAPLVASLKLQKNLAINELEKLKTDIIKNIGALTPEQEKYFDVLAKNIDTQFKESIDEVINPDMLGTYLKNTLSKGLQTDVIPQAEETKSIWELFGIDPESEKGQEQIDALQEGADTIMGIMDDVFSRRVELAERERELIDDRISQLQNELELEAELMEEGYANNVDAKRKELDELKKQRQQALADEEAAIKRQRIFESISQATSLTTAVANILKSFTKLGPFGLALASGAIATMHLLFSSAKAKAVDATKLAEGGSGSDTGIIKGKRHAQGGERFLDHVEVEQGEAWGVLSRRASGKYGRIFHEMVSSFNRDEMPDFAASPVNNNIKINNDGSNSRLDRLIYENRQLRNDMKQARQYTIGNKRVVQKGKNTRIIG
jgi:hypothetical protein